MPQEHSKKFIQIFLPKQVQLESSSKSLHNLYRAPNHQSFVNRASKTSKNFHPKIFAFEESSKNHKSLTNSNLYIHCEDYLVHLPTKVEEILCLNQDFIYTNHGLKKLFKMTESENYSFCKRTKNRKLHSFINKYKFIFVKHFQFFFFLIFKLGIFCFQNSQV